MGRIEQETSGSRSGKTRLIVACLSAALIATACIPRDTSQIVLDEERTFSGFGASWDLEYYVNNAYECGLSGNYSFMVMNPAGDPNAEAPLWVFLHGGAVGYWDDQGDYYAAKNQDEDSHNHQEDFDRLIWHLEVRTLDGDGQPEDQTLVRRIQEGYRVLVVGYCDHDLYLGIGSKYPNHPTNPNAKVNGLQATMAAIDYTAANYPTTQVWAHGTSAGSAGVWGLASSYGSEGTPLTGGIADSTILSPNYSTVVETLGPLGQTRLDPGFEPEGVTEKVGWFSDPAIPSFAEAQIADRDFRAVPVMWIGGDADPFCSGNRSPITEAAALGISNCGYTFLGISDAVANQANTPHEFHLLPATGHVPTNDPGPANDLVDDFIDNVLATNPPNFGP